MIYLSTIKYYCNFVIQAQEYLGGYLIKLHFVSWALKLANFTFLYYNNLGTRTNFHFHGSYAKILQKIALYLLEFYNRTLIYINYRHMQLSFLRRRWKSVYNKYMDIKNCKH